MPPECYPQGYEGMRRGGPRWKSSWTTSQSKKEEDPRARTERRWGDRGTFVGGGDGRAHMNGNMSSVRVWCADGAGEFATRSVCKCKRGVRRRAPTSARPRPPSPVTAGGRVEWALGQAFLGDRPNRGTLPRRPPVARRGCRANIA